MSQASPCVNAGSGAATLAWLPSWLCAEDSRLVSAWLAFSQAAQAAAG